MYIFLHKEIGLGLRVCFFSASSWKSLKMSLGRRQKTETIIEECFCCEKLVACIYTSLYYIIVL